MERGFLIHKSYTSTEAYRLSILLKEIDEITERKKWATNVERIHLRMIWENTQDIIMGNPSLKEAFYFEIDGRKEKVRSLLG